jgi:hypothetical protein
MPGADSLYFMAVLAGLLQDVATFGQAAGMEQLDRVGRLVVDIIAPDISEVKKGFAHGDVFEDTAAS